MTAFMTASLSSGSDAMAAESSLKASLSDFSSLTISPADNDILLFCVFLVI
jgi:hypothetical protein